jgi:hypothetical protein
VKKMLNYGKKFFYRYPEACRLAGTYSWFKGKRRTALKWWKKGLKVAAEKELNVELGRINLEIARRLEEATPGTATAGLTETPAQTAHLQHTFEGGSSGPSDTPAKPADQGRPSISPTGYSPDHPAGTPKSPARNSEGQAARSLTGREPTFEGNPAPPLHGHTPTFEGHHPDHYRTMAEKILTEIGMEAALNDTTIPV